MMTRRLLTAGAAALLGMSFPAVAQLPSAPYVRWAELSVDPGRKQAFDEAARHNAVATLNEPGVIAFHAAAEKDNPNRVRVLEIYRNEAAYREHLQSTHFQQFARVAQGALLERQVHDTVPIALGVKPHLTAAAPHVRVAELEIATDQMAAYKAAVIEEIEDSIRLEPGVLAIYSMSLKETPNRLRFFEVYADEAAYRSHIASPHFRKYVETTKSMITSRKLFEMVSPSLGVKAHAQMQAPLANRPAYYVAEFELTDPEGIRPYSAVVESTFVPFGGKYAVRGGPIASLEGEPMKRVIMIVFPSLAQAQAWYASPQYREIISIRHNSAKSRVFIMEGLPH